jgi:transcriptional regulator with XRE-family HTH domain
MAEQRNPPGPIGQNVIQNIEQLRQARGLSYEALSAELAKIGHPINPVSLSRLGRGERRVGADDVVAFAIALGVNPSALMLPRNGDDDEQIKLTPAVSRRFGDAWIWVDGQRPLPADDDSGLEDGKHWERLNDFQQHARPHGGQNWRGPMIGAIFELLRKWEIAYQDWANPDNYDMRVRHLGREIKRVDLRSEDEIERLQREGSVNEQQRLRQWQVDHPGATEYPSYRPGEEDFDMITYPRYSGEGDGGAR